MERRLLQIAIFIAGLVPILIGLAGVAWGVQFISPADNPAIDGIVRFLSGVLLAVGVQYWISIPHIEKHQVQFSVLTFILVFGALARLTALFFGGVPAMGTVFIAVVALVYVPLLWMWQRRLAHNHKVYSTP
jgi:predicted MFS family arabinose efflux permease